MGWLPAVFPNTAQLTINYTQNMKRSMLPRQMVEETGQLLQIAEKVSNAIHVLVVSTRTSDKTELHRSVDLSKARLRHLRLVSSPNMTEAVLHALVRSESAHTLRSFVLRVTVSSALLGRVLGSLPYLQVLELAIPSERTRDVGFGVYLFV
jgi:hypothetical protein